jgi:glycerophosphoryl diester phosphodiesterase
MLILGHRGASADFPENTLEAFTAAIAQGADGVELDVMRCGSGDLVVCHDEELSRLARRPWVVARTPWWKLKRADVGSALGFRPARIPLLHEVFEALPASALVNVEIKCETLDDRGLSEKVGDFIAERGLSGRVLVSSFNPLCLIRLAKKHPAIRRGLLVDPDRGWKRQLVFLPFTANESIHLNFADIDARRAERYHRRGLKLAAWTVDDLATARALRGWGVEMLITNRPGEMKQRL